MKSVLLTGVAGFLGRYIARHFARAGWRVLGVDVVPPENAPIEPGMQYLRLSLPSPELAGLLSRERPALCIHCAGRASVPLSMEDPRADFFDNTVLTFELLEALRRHAPQCRFILLSSAAVYGNPRTLPVSENTHVAPLSPYGFHKRQCELLCQEFARIYALPALSVRIFSAYGAGLRRQVVWDICAKILGTGSLKLSGTGRESRDFIHAADVARALELLADRAPAQGEVYNLASGVEVTIAELATQLIAALGADCATEFDGTTRPGDPLNWRADLAKIAALGFAPQVSLAAGLRGVADWSRAELRCP